MQQRPQQQQARDIHFPAILYGGDYNPEQWISQEDGSLNSVWQEDLRLMHKAGINLVTLGVFSWASLQPTEDTFTFDWLDQILDQLAEQHIFVCLGTGTAAQPAWLSAAYPDVLPVNEWGMRRWHGRRLNYCPTNVDFRRLAQNMGRVLAERYGNHPALLLWHVSNEYGPSCYCDHCAMRFREWLQQRYGSLEELNRRWVTAFWGHTYTSWEQIQPPSQLGERSIQSLTLDYQRFLSDMNLECYRAEEAILHELTPHIPVMTNFHGLQRQLDYFSWAPYQDIIGWDSYPRHDAHPSTSAFYFDLMRSLKDGQPWLLMEQTPSQVQWHPENPLKRPGVMRLQSYQALAHGSNSVLFFQWRQSRVGEEMYHGAIVSHAGHEHTRVFQEVAMLGAELRSLKPDLLATRLHARAALLMSWPNWWAVENPHVPSQRLRYLEELQCYYQALWKRNIPVDIISPDDALEGYDLVLAPLFNLISQEQGTAIERYVEQGGTFLTTYFSGVIDENHCAWLGGAPGPLRRTLGIWVEEFDPLPEGVTNTLVSTPEAEGWEESYSCEHWCEVVHLEGAQVLSVFGADFYAGRPAITMHALGNGRAFYVATRPDAACLDTLIGDLVQQISTHHELLAPQGVEVTQRHGEQTTYTFLLNHLRTEQDVTLFQPMRDILTQQVYEQELRLPAFGVAILIPRERREPTLTHFKGESQ
ncbi:MAG TPA: beta-galactosidase [Ktedonobacteraceae bacterium]|nr:beta-galactosidase [Ktedonobacteraceae bacterium]